MARKIHEQVRLEPVVPVVAGTWGTWRIVYTAGPAGIAPGGGVKVVYHATLLPVFDVRGDWTTPQVDDPAAAGYTTAETTGAAKAKLEIVTQPKIVPDAPLASPRAVRALIRKAPLRPGESIIITFGDTSGCGPGTCVQHIAQTDFEFTIYVDSSGTNRWERLEDSPRLDILGGPAVGLSAVAPSVVRAGEEFSLAVIPLDAFGHSATGFDASVALASSDEAESVGSEAISQTADGYIREGLRLRTAGVQRITVKGGGFQADSNPILLEADSPLFNLYWGDIHGHSTVSDGMRSPDDYYRYARDVSRMDFTALTDHDSARGKRGRDPAVWDLVHRKVVEYHEPGRFVTFFGYEWTSIRYGHKCVYYLRGNHPVFAASDPAYDTPAKLYAALQGRPAMAIPHHTAGGPVPADLSAVDPVWEPLIEIYSCHGCSDAAGIGRRLWRFTKGRGFYVQEALNQGYRLGIISGSDTHTSDPGNPLVDNPLSPHPHRVGIMAVYASDLTREALWEAMWARRVYGTTGERILVDFRVDGHMMGEEVSLSAPPFLQVKVAGTAPLDRVEVIRNGEVILTRQTEARDLSFAWQEEEIHPGYYYLRVTQSDEEMAWSSPIWVAAIEEAGRAGCQPALHLRQSIT